MIIFWIVSCVIAVIVSGIVLEIIIDKKRKETNMSTMTINGRVYNNISGKNISINGDAVYVDGKLMEEGLKGIVKVEWVGDLVSLSTQSTVECSGDIHGDVDAGNSVKCGNVGGNVKAGNSVTCGNISGNAKAGNSINKR